MNKLVIGFPKILFERFIITTVILANVIFLSLFVYYHDHGFDITDEAFYALSSTQPENVLSGISFGYITNHIMNIFNCDFHDTRIIGYILLLCSTFWLSNSCIRKYFDYNLQKRFGISLIMSTPCLIYYTYGIFSINYNLYTIIGLNFMLSAYYSIKDREASLAYVFLSGLGIYMILMSKFTSLPIIILIFLVLYFLNKDYRIIKMVRESLIAFLIIFSAHMMFSYDSFYLFINRHLNIYETLPYLGTGHIKQFNPYYYTKEFINFLKNIC